MGLNDLHERRSITPINDLFSKWDMSCRKFANCWRAPASEVSMPQIVANTGKSMSPMIWDNSCACWFITRTTSSVSKSADSPDGLSVQPWFEKNKYHIRLERVACENMTPLITDRDIKQDELKYGGIKLALVLINNLHYVGIWICGNDVSNASQFYAVRQYRECQQ